MMTSLFRRPKKPIRPRMIITESELGEDDEDNSGSPRTEKKEKEKKVIIGTGAVTEDDKRASSLLSFDDDLKDDDDGEIFRVKKSSVSRRLMKRRDREKKDPKPPSINNPVIKSERTPSSVQYSSGGNKNKNNVNTSVPETLKKDNSFVRILNGREAEAVDMESGSDDEDDSGRPEYSKRSSRSSRDVLSDTLRRTLEQAQIPDANLVHEVRKRRQMARSLGGPGAPAFIPVSDSERLRMQKSRLIREDDENDHSEEEDEDERIDFVIGNTASAVREKRKEAFDAAQEQIVKSDGDSEMEMDEWESQQLRKGVSKTQMNNVALEVKQQKDFFSNDWGQQVSSNGSYDSSKYSDNKFAQEPESDNSSISVGYNKKPAEMSVENIVNGIHKINPELILDKLTNRLDNLNLTRAETEREISGLNVDLELIKSEVLETGTSVPILSSNYTLYQRLRGYVTDLVDCLRCKVPVIRSLEQRMTQLLKTRHEHLVERRRQDVRDQLEEVNMILSVLNSGGSSLPPPPSSTDSKSRRAAEREGRRTRRRRLRELKGVFPHKDGLSSDDEETELEITTFKTQKEMIVKDALLVFEDVNPEFSNLDDILAKFREWREADLSSYQESYTYLCIPKLIAPFIRLSVLGWDPLTDDSDLMDCEWIKPLLMYGFVENETLQTLISDPDSRTVPLVIEKVFIPWIDSLVKATWDPTSVRQTRRLVNLVKKLTNEWSVGANTKAMNGLMCTIISKFKDTVDNDVFIPIFPKSAMTNKCSPASVFSARQFWSSVKILDNISAWTGLLSDKPLQMMALDALLTRYILLGIRTAGDLGESAEKANGVVTVLPRLWFSKETTTELPNGIQQLIRCLVFAVQSSDCSLTVNRVAVPEIAKILRTIGAVDESQIILNKYS